MDNQAIAERLKVVLASAYSFAIKAQNYHWNVIGPNFVVYHRFFQEIYEQVHEDIDAYAEHVRILGMFVPGSLSRFSDLTRIKDELAIPTSNMMIERLLEDNMKMIDILKSVHGAANDTGNPGLTSFLEERIQYHDKLGWMLRSLSS
jgi:starvation-inducible DNA-binding protein